ncbi:hypothetical protein [Serratia marcescens]|uniref:hypothetical protein n=1 Tax=Serratia marcescens TaxID=615 RepID=UPI00143E7A0D|nr:hypothetical protein [Serratia marcescens]QIX78380.1 hypothetical protein FOB67_18265 [Serratia marcescens]
MKKIKWLLILILAIVSITILAKPILLYREQMDSTLSLKNSDWGDFGSFIGGVYGSLLSSITLLVIIITSYITNSINNEQVRLLRNEQHFSNFSKLLEHLKHNYIKFYNSSDGVSNIHNFYKRFEGWLAISVISIDYDEELTIGENLFNNATKRFSENEQYKDLLLKEAKLFKCIIGVIESSPSELSDAMKVIFETTFSEAERFSLSTYTYAHYPETRAFLKSWVSLAIVPPQSVVQAKHHLKLNERTWID